MPVRKEVVDEQLKALGDFSRFFTRGEFRCLPELLIEGETVHAATSGFFESKTWIIVVTNHRLLFLDRRLFQGLRQVDIPLGQVTSVSHTVGLFFGEIEVATASGIKAISHIAKKDVTKVTSIICGLISGRTAPRAAPPSGAWSERGGAIAAAASAVHTDLASQLERLGALKEKGLLSDDEFTAGKARLLQS